MMDTHPNGWRVGMKVWSVITLNRRNGPDISEQEITKIGRKWIYIGRLKFDADSLWIDGGKYANPGRVYTSLEEYEEQTELAKTFSELRQAIGYTPERGVTVSDLKEVSRLLRLNPPGTQPVTP